MRILLTIVAVMASALAFACEPTDQRIAYLSITPTELVGVDRALTIAVDSAGCAEIRRPSHFRERGRFRVQLSASERAALSETLQDEQLRSFAAEAVQTAITELAARRAQGGELFEVNDADRYVLELSGQGRDQRLVWLGLWQYAAQYPEVAALQSFKVAAEQLQALAMLSRAEKQSESQP